MQNKNTLTLPIAIIIAGIIVAGAIFFSKDKERPIVTNKDNVPEINLVPINNSDHILGNPNAPIKIVEYSDPSCPYCRMFHNTMRQIMNEYGATGKVAWIYRHYTLDKPDANGNILHPNANHEAQALECANQIGGNDKFWEYANRLYDITPSVTINSPQGLDQNQLPEIATYINIDKNKFRECLNSGKFKALVDQQYLDGVNAGASGTPYSIMITSKGKMIPINGAYPFSNLKTIIDSLLNLK
jgi:protein-disulfide isomerase